jgi:hypothetical protein
MDSRTTISIWHVGNWCIHLGQTYVESPFKSEKTYVELLNLSSGGSTGRHCPHWGINFMKWTQYRQFWKQVFAG